MTRTYTVKQGDTLSEIAQEHGARTSEVHTLNPYITDPDYIRPDWEVELPESAEATAPSELPEKIELPPPMHADNTSTLACEGQPECHQELVDVAHVTGDPDFLVLTQEQSDSLKQEVDFVQKLMDELHKNLAQALPVTQCKKVQDPNASCACSNCVKQAWSIKAEGAGLLTRVDAAQGTNIVPFTTAKVLQGEIARLQEARDWYARYTPDFVGTTQFESNWEALQSRKVLQLDQEIHKLRLELAAQKQADSPYSLTFANNATPDLKHGKGRSTDQQRGVQTRTGIHVVEVILFSDPTRRHYIRIRYRETTRWKVRVSTRVMAGKPFNKQLAGALMKDIKGAIAQGRKAGPLGNLELKIASWASTEDNMLNALHQEVKWASDPSDGARYASAAEAHALRFAASASAGVNNWNPKEGNIDIGVKGSAAFSLGEGSISMRRFFPSQGGYVANMSYKNALGEEVLHPMGVFRLSGKLEFNCFVGVKAGGEAGAKIQYKPSNREAGATALLGTPTMDVGPSGFIGVKCDAFAGAQLGGAVSGAFEWIEPDSQALGKPVLGQANASSSWVKFAEIKAEGNAAWGVGGNGEFGLSITENRLAFNVRGSVVLGPGAGGGFGTVIDIEQVGKVTLLLCNALAEMDYRQLLGVTSEAFGYIAKGIYKIATSPRRELIDAFSETAIKISDWWDERKASRLEALDLARFIVDREDHKFMVVKEQVVPFSQLPPETLGPMVYMLVEGYADSLNELQEKALVMLLSEIRSWRHFIEVLEHCSHKGEKVNAMKSLEKINTLLDGYEQIQFNRYIGSLAIHQAPSGGARMAWKTSNAWRKEKVLFSARGSGKFDGLV